MIGCGINGAETARMLVAHGVAPLVWDVDAARRQLVADRLGARVCGERSEALGCEVVDDGDPGRRRPLSGGLAGGRPARLAHGRGRAGKAEVAIEELRRATSSATTGSRRATAASWPPQSRRATIERGDVTELGAVLVGEAEGRRSAGDITLFDSTGLAIQDLAIAKVAYSKARRAGLQTIEL